MKRKAYAKISALVLTGLFPASVLSGAETPVPSAAAKPPAVKAVAPASAQNPATAPVSPVPAAVAPQAPVAMEEVRHYPGKIAGDNAFQEQSFADAARFYDSYLKEATLKKDTPAILDAYECKINALIMAADIQQAEKMLKAYAKIAKKESALSIELWKLDLMLLQGKAAAAEGALKKLMPGISKQDPRRTRAEIMLAAAYDLQGKYTLAVEIYANLREQTSGSDFNRRISERQILSLTACGQLEKAFDVLKSLGDDRNERNIEARHFLNIYLALKGSSAESTNLKFEKKNVITIPKQDDFFYLITSLTGDEFVLKHDYQSALNAYRLAYSYARNHKEVTDTLTRMTVMLDKMNEKKEAAELAMKLLDIFHLNTTDLKTKQFIAKLFFDAGKQSEALKLFEQIFAADKAKPNGMINHLVKTKQYEHAIALINLYYKKTPGSADALTSLAAVELARGDKNKATQLYIDAYKAGSMNAASRAIRLLMEMKEYTRLIELTEQIIREKGDNAEAYFFQAKAKELLGQLDEARTAFLFCERNGAFVPAQALFNAAAISYRQNDYKRAGDDFKRIFDTPKPDYQKLAPEAAYWQVLCAYNLSNAQSLEKITFALMKKFPESDFTASAMLLLAEVYIKSNLPDKAEDLLTKISGSKISPSIHANALHRQAVLAYNRKNYASAEALLLKIRTDYASVTQLADNYFLLGDIYRAQSNFTAAAAAYEEAAKRRPGSRLAQAATGAMGDCIFALAAASDSQNKFKEAKEIYKNLLQMQNLLPEYRIMTDYKIARCTQLIGETDAAFEQYRMLVTGCSREQLRNPVIRFWVIKGMDALELIALKSTNIEKINDAGRTMDSLNRSGGMEKQNYPARIQRLNHYKLQLINSGGTK